MSLSVLAKSAQMAWLLLESYEVDPEPIFRSLHIDPRTMDDMSARLNQSTVDELWQNVADSVNDPCFGLKIGKQWHPSYMHALGYAWLASSSLHTAFYRLQRFIHVMNQAVKINIDETKDRFSVSTINTVRKKNKSWHADGGLSILMAMCRANYGEELNPLLVTFKHERPDCAGDFYEYFRCEIEFGAKKDVLVFSQEVINKRLPSSNPALAQISDQLMIEYLAKLDENDIEQRVKAAIIKLLPDGRVTDVKIADELYMSNRTLQRKLQEQGTTFKQLMTDVRKELALKYIQDRQMTLTELSFQLGFSQISAFSRAFKDWMGASPRQYRQSL